MTRRMKVAVNRAEEQMIQGCTSLKMKVVLLYQGQPVENALCHTTAEVKAWGRAKVDQWSPRHVTFRLE